MHGYVIVYFCLSFVIAVHGEQDTKIFIQHYGSTICPYTNFCHTKATKTLNNDTLMPCCLPCTCETNCWNVGNCCPDRNVTDFELPDLPCKATIVKQSTQDKLIYHGHYDGIARYRIKDTCLSNENNETLIKLCERKNKTTIEEYTWVSEKNSGKIFQNRYCALCNNVSDVVEWQIRTRFFNIMKTNFSHLSRSIFSHRCDLITEIPESQLKVTERYRCFIPTVSKCNVSGLWTHFDEDIEKGCETYDSQIFVPSVRMTDIFKNIYCYICNVEFISITNTVCKNFQLDFRNPENSFSALMDFKKFQSDGKVLLSTKCRVEEVYDQFMVG